MKAMKIRPRPVYLEITALVLGVVALAILSLSFLTVVSISQSHADFQAEKVGSLAGLVAAMPEIRQALVKGDPEGFIALRAEQIGAQIGAWVIVMDRNSIRYSHTNPALIGYPFTGGDEGSALLGQHYVSHAVGISGPSLRGFAPILGDNGAPIGAVCVGILNDGMTEGIEKTKKPVYYAAFISVSIGLLGAFFVSRRIKESIFGYEPHEIATRFQQLDTILGSITAGIIAVDHNGDITMINRNAKEMLGIEPGSDVLGLNILKILPTTRLLHVMKTAKTEYDQEQEFPSGEKVITTRVPLNFRGSVAGAMAIFRPRTEIARLAEELTGVKKYVAALRAQAHEFSNKLQTISGLIELGDYESSVAYINRIAGDQKDLVSLLVQNIKEPFVGGLLIGKISEASERGVQVSVDPGSRLSALGPGIPGNVLITVVGNLLDNAIDAVACQDQSKRIVFIQITDAEEAIHILIRDNGVGMAPEIIKHVFAPGFSTKGENRGFGMANVRQCLDTVEGRIEIRSEARRGTEVEVWIPKRGGLGCGSQDTGR